MTDFDGLSFDEWLDREKQSLDEAREQPPVRRQTPVRREPEPVFDEPAPPAQRSLWSRWKWLLISLTALLTAGVCLLGAGFVYAGRVAEITTIFPNVVVNGVAVGGMTVDEAAAVLGDDPAKYDNAAVTVRFSTGDSVTVTAQQLGLRPVNGMDFAKAAYNYGRDGSLLANLMTYQACRKGPMNMAVDYAVRTGIDRSVIAALVAPVAQQIDEKLRVTQAQIGEDAITLVKNAAGQTVDVDAVCALVQDAFEREDYSGIDYDVTAQSPSGAQESVQTDAAAMLRQLYDEIYAAPADAMYDPVTGGVTDSVTGVRFDMDDALRRWDAALTGQTVTIPLIREEPALTGEQLTGMLFADVLAEKSTSLYGSTSARINNVTLAAAALNGTVLQPGQEFNYNACLGERTAAKGYQEAGAFANGQHVMSIGGGICQDSSTLYYCAMKANLCITTRYCHQFVVGYLPRGMDATVSWGFPDFKFVNSRSYPIRIDAYVADGSLTIRLMGTDVDGSYVEITNETWEDDTHYYAQTYRNVYDVNGNLISSAKEAFSSYDKEEAVQATPTPAPEPEPIPEENYEPPVTEPAPAPDVQTDIPLDAPPPAAPDTV